MIYSALLDWISNLCFCNSSYLGSRLGKELGIIVSYYEAGPSNDGLTWDYYLASGDYCYSSTCAGSDILDSCYSALSDLELKTI